MNWHLLPQFAINGLLEGGPIALLALGIVLIYKSSEIFNFAHGQMLLVGAMTTWWFSSARGFGRWLDAETQFALLITLSIVAAVIVSVLLGLLIERLALRPMTGQPLLSIILMTLALGQVLQGSIILTFGTVQRNFPVLFKVIDPFRLTLPIAGPAGAPEAGCRLIFGELTAGCAPLILQRDLVWSFAIAMVLVTLLYLFFQFTRTGLAMRATAEDHETAQAVGIRINQVFGISWAIAGIVATAGGILIATSSGLDLSLSVVVLAAFPAVLLGGLESIPGAIVGGLAVGLAQGIVGTPNADFFLGAEVAQAIRNSREIVPYVLLLIVLLVRPDGLFGQKRIERI